MLCMLYFCIYVLLTCQSVIFFCLFQWNDLWMQHGGIAATTPPNPGCPRKPPIFFQTPFSGAKIRENKIVKFYNYCSKSLVFLLYNV